MSQAERSANSPGRGSAAALPSVRSAAKAWPLRPGFRTRQLRRRLCRQYQGRPVPADHRRCGPHPAAHGPSGRCGCEPNTGDGAGILTGLPHEFLRKSRPRPTLASSCPNPAFTASATFSCRPTRPERDSLQRTRQSPRRRAGAKAFGLAPLADRELKRLISALRRGRQSRRWSSSIIAAADGLDRESFDRQLYVIRKTTSRHPADERTHAGADVLHLLAVLEGDRLQGNAHRRTN